MDSEIKNTSAGSVQVCKNCKKDFVIEPDDFDFYERMKVPPPTWCPECRLRRRIMWRNEKTMHRRKCDATGKMTFSTIAPDAPFKVYERDYWWSDAWNPLDYGKDVDFSRPFLEQINELFHQVPVPSRSVVNMVNSDYCMNSSAMKNSYLVFHATHDEDCQYSVGLDGSKNCSDCLFVSDSELCYECFLVNNSYKLMYCADCDNSQNLFLCQDCAGCQNCFGCVGLRNKTNHIFNEQYTKEEYQEKIKAFDLGSTKGLENAKAEFDKFKLSVPNKYIHARHTTNVSGDYIYHAKNTLNSYRVANIEDVRYCQNIVFDPGAKDCYDYSFFGQGSELIYESASVGIQSSNIKFCSFVYNSVSNIEYSIYCTEAHNFFGCVGVKSKQYCILNKQYTKEEYEELVPKIKKHMEEMPYVDAGGRVYTYGEFFPPEFCPFGYNETVAQEYLPFTKKGAMEAGFPWREMSTKEYVPTKSWKDIPASIQEADDSIIKEVILCRSWDEQGEEKALEHNCSKAFKITAEELAFYKRMGAPIPQRCFNSRHFERSKLRNPVSLWKRKCMCDKKHSHHEGKCTNEFETSYSPDRKEIVYCEQCYQQEVA